MEFEKEWHGTLTSYVIGFTASIVLTAASFLLVISKLLSGQALVHSLIGLALIQAIVQLRFFLHLGEEPKPRWETITFYVMFIILVIVAIGSLWIMNDLNNRMMMSHD